MRLMGCHTLHVCRDQVILRVAVGFCFASLMSHVSSMVVRIRGPATSHLDVEHITTYRCMDEALSPRRALGEAICLMAYVCTQSHAVLVAPRAQADKCCVSGTKPVGGGGVLLTETEWLARWMLDGGM